MNPFKKLQHFFIGKALAKTNDAFEHVNVIVLFNFTVFFFITNLPYIAISTHSPVHMAFAISVLSALMAVLVILRWNSNVRAATMFFLFNFFVQEGGHYVIDNGRMGMQGLLFSVLFILSGYLLLNRAWGTGILIYILISFIVGVYNINSNYSLWKVPAELTDPPEEGIFMYFAIIPVLLNAYLVSQFVMARQKAERQLWEQKRMIEEKQKEILDSIHYAKRIQKSLMPAEPQVEKMLKRMHNS